MKRDAQTPACGRDATFEKAARLTPGAALLALSLLTSGCEEPPNAVPVLPPGVEARRMPQIPEEQAPQAIGETGMRAGEGAESQSPIGAVVSPPTRPGQSTRTSSGLVYETLKEGNGPEARPGQTVQVHYTGTFPDGKKFDSSRDQGGPITFTLGNREVIHGWDEGVSGMHVGERRKLIIPAELAYGKVGRPPLIGPNQTLHFEVELVDVK